MTSARARDGARVPISIGIHRAFAPNGSTETRRYERLKLHARAHSTRLVERRNRTPRRPSATWSSGDVRRRVAHAMFSKLVVALRSISRSNAGPGERRCVVVGTANSASAAASAAHARAERARTLCDLQDESERLERIFMTATPREREEAYAVALQRARPPPPPPPGTDSSCFTSLVDALVANFDEADREMARRPAAGYVRNPRGLGTARRYPLAESERVEFARSAKIVGVSTGMIPKSATVECRLDVRCERRRFGRVDVRTESVSVGAFIAGKLGSRFELGENAQTAERRGELCEAVFKAQAARLADTRWETDGSIDVFFTPHTNFLPAGHTNLSGALRDFVLRYFDPLDGARFAVVSYDASGARHRLRWDSDELGTRAPWRVIRFDTGEMVDLTSSDMRTMCLWRVGVRQDFMTCAIKRIERYERNARRHATRDVQRVLKTKLRDAFREGVLGLGVARHVVEIGAGSALSSREIAASSAAFDGRDVVCYALDPHITSLVHDTVRNHARVVLVEEGIEDVDVSTIPPIGIVRFVLAAPECAAVSVAAQPSNKRLREQKGDAFGDLVRACAIRVTCAMTRCCVDFIKYFNAPGVIENPSGNSKVGLFNERRPFYGWRLRTIDTSYCKYGRPFRKHTTFVTNVPTLTLEPPCSSEHPCPATFRERAHATRCSLTGSPRAVTKLHPPALIRSIVKQVDEFIDRLSRAHLATDADTDGLIDPASLPREDELLDARERKRARRFDHRLRPFTEVSVFGRSENGLFETWFAEIVGGHPTRRDHVRVKYLVETAAASNVFEYERRTGGAQTIHVDSILDVFDRGHFTRTF